MSFSGPTQRQKQTSTTANINCGQYRDFLEIQIKAKL